MNRYSISTLPRIARALALTGMFAAASLFAQQAPTDSAPPSPPPQSPAPVERRGPSDQGPQQHVYRGNFPPREDRRGGGPPSSMDFGMSMRLGPPGAWWKNPTIVQRISLTPEQVKKMDDILQQSRLQLVDLKANLEKQNLLLDPLLSANPVDTAKALLQIDKVAQARADLEKANARMLLSIRSVLTPDQWTKLRPEGGHFGPYKGPGPRPGQ